MISHEVSRRDWLAGAAGTALAGTARGQTRPAPASPVAIARCRAYDATFDQALEAALDRIGGAGSLVKGKTVAVKLNLTGNITRFPNRPDLPYRNDPATVLSLARQIARAGATRIRLIESFFPAKQDLELWARYGLDVNAINNVGCKVEWENKQNMGQAKQYTRIKVPWIPANSPRPRNPNYLPKRLKRGSNSVNSGFAATRRQLMPHPGEFGPRSGPKDLWKNVSGENVWGEASLDACGEAQTPDLLFRSRNNRHIGYQFP